MLTQVALALAIGATAVSAQSSTIPLAAKRFDYNNLPYQADTGDGERGRQSGYNICNSTTAGQDSLCQTAIINSLDDFCLWGPQEPGGIVGNIEGEMVAWCTKEGHGTRIIPPGALTGVQFMRTPNYVQVTGRINQELIYIAADDDGGEMDPHGADQRGNPLGGLVFSNAFGANSSRNGTTSSGAAYSQVVQWHNFMGANVFCLKACDPDYELGYQMCEHIYDRVGCNVNAPAAYEDGVFETCLGDDQLPPGFYIQGGATLTYTQPPEGQVIATLPYVPAIPSSSSCTPYESADLYTAGAAVSGSSSAVSSSATSSGVSSGSSTATSSGASSGSRSTSAPVSTGASSAGQSAPSSAPSASPTGAANKVAAGGLLGLAGIVAAML